MINFIRYLRFSRWKFLESRRLKKKINSLPLTAPLKIIIGAGPTNMEGWISTDLPYFDITNQKHWKKYFHKRKINKLLAEHVLEHLSEEQVKELLATAFKYLNHHGVFRIAVPDAYHPNKEYIDAVKQGGFDIGADTHQSFWNYKTLTQTSTFAGYTKYILLEYADEYGLIHCSDFDEADGIIKRSKSKNFQYHISNYSSLIIDLIK